MSSPLPSRTVLAIGAANITAAQQRAITAAATGADHEYEESGTSPRFGCSDHLRAGKIAPSASTGRYWGNGTTGRRRQLESHHLLGSGAVRPAADRLRVASACSRGGAHRGEQGPQRRWVVLRHVLLPRPVRRRLRADRSPRCDGPVGAADTCTGGEAEG